MHLDPNSIRKKIFRKVSSDLKRRGTKLTDDEMRDVCRRVMAGVMYFIHHYTEWWKFYDSSRPFDVGNPLRAPNNFVREKFGLGFQNMRVDLAEEFGFIPKRLDSDDEKEALNAFWNATALFLQEESLVAA